MVDYYGEAIGSLSCEMYEKTASAQGTTIPPAQPAETPTYGEVAKATLGSLKQSEKMVSLAIGRLVKTVGADTTLKNAERDNAEAAWISYGENCDYCLNLASKGWQHVTKNTLKNGHAEHIHANCKCQYSVRFNKESGVEGYEPDKLSEKHKEALKSEQESFIIELKENPSALGKKTPAEWKEHLERIGYEVKPLNSGNFKGISFENGGGYKANFGGDGLIQYHPEARSHHGGAYYKISTGEGGTKRYELDGTEKKEVRENK